MREFFQVFPKISNFSPRIASIYGNIPHLVHIAHLVHIPTPFFVIFITFHCIFSDFDPNFVTLYQVWSPNYQFYPILMMFWKVEQKNKNNKKRQVFSEILQFLSWNLVNFWKYCPFSASFDH